MAEIDFNQIYDGVTLALHRAFPDSRIHGGTVDQGLTYGDFNVLPITASHTAGMGIRAGRKSLFDVIYYPSDAGGRTECLRISHILPGVLGTIQTKNGDMLHCLSFEVTIDDDELHCIVGYPYFVYEPKTGDSMENLNFE